jgi:hypothetical protein
VTTERDIPLLTVVERFKIENWGVVLAPDFPLPQETGWKEYTFFVEVVHECGATSKLRAVASPVHHLVRNPTVSGGGWRLTIVLPGATKEEIPIGSTVLCSAATHQRLFGTSSTAT